MIQEITQLHYLGVLCSRCNARIPVPKKVAALYEEVKHGEVSDGQDVNTRAFTLRCKACDEEGVYAMEAIREFEGSPRGRTGKGKVARA
jgi:hypothetical protein